jgi:murein DD-endopeptidase MepM/ murein hydrolase activator NlpD
LRPGATPLAVGPFAGTSGTAAAFDGPFEYPAAAPFVSARSADVGACGATGLAGRVSLTGVTLLDDVGIGRIELSGGQGVVTGLSVRGVAVDPPRPGGRLSLGSWGYLTTGEARSEPQSVLHAALALHLMQAQGGLAAGTTLLVGFGTTPIPRATPPTTSPSAATTAPRAGTGKRSPAKTERSTRSRRARGSAKRKARTGAGSGQPLKVTPPLALRHYTFPVAGPSDYVDTYGGFRSDVPGNWHHGDDIFATLGTPVVAVAGGTLNRVGWEKLGGWRLWVRDSAGDEFYYAHLSGYAPAAMHETRVRAGEIIGYIGNTGDAFTTSPHLHFEVHPRQLLHLGYNGAVDPTKYLNGWTHVSRRRDPRPEHPSLPSTELARHEATVNFRELLSAHHLVSTPRPRPVRRPKQSVPAPSSPASTPTAPRVAAAAPNRVASGSDSWIIAVAAAVAVAVIIGWRFVIARRPASSPDA